MVNLSTQLRSVKFLFPVFNASGIFGSTENELKKIFESEAGAVMSKSITLKDRKGNSGVRFFWDDVSSVNSMGLPNLGAEYYLGLPKKFENFKKPFFASIAGFTSNEFVKLIDIYDCSSFSGIEVNLSCPNIEGKGIFAYDFITLFKLLKKIRIRTKKILGVKLPPYRQREEVQTVAEELINIGIDFITTMNTYPLSCFIDSEKETMRLTPNGGIGGLGGKSVKPIALSQVVLFNQFSKGKLPIIAVGGVNNARDVYEYILAGASAVQIGTGLLRKGPSIFKIIKKDLKEILLKKRIKNISNKIGRLRVS